LYYFELTVSNQTAGVLIIQFHIPKT